MLKLRDLKYVLAFLGPLVAYLGVRFLGPWTWGVVVLEFVMIPLLESLHSGSPKNPSEEEEKRLNRMRWFDFLLYLNLPILYVLLFLHLQTIVSTPLHMLEAMGLTLSMGIMIGTIGINVAHELGHRPNLWDQWVARLLLIPGWYSHFTIEHNLGHHKHVSTPEDPSSARKGENIYRFWIRSVAGVYRGAWIIENERLEREGLSTFSFQNRMIIFQILQFGYALIILLFFGGTGLLFAIISGVIGFLLLESVNYIEHYGLSRKQMPSGRYERVGHQHSWNSNHELGRIFLFELTRHSDHHFQANKKYQVLRNEETSPQLPLGYPGSILLALVPWAWFRKMNRMLPLLLLITVSVQARTFEVGSGLTYPTPWALSRANVLLDGDTVLIRSGEYRGRDALAVWRPHRLVIIGDMDRPALYADGQYILGKGIWVCSGNDISVTNVEFYNASVPDKNGAGIRLDGVGLYINHCHFENNENGILTSNPGTGTIEIRNSIFTEGGFGDGFSHNLYIGRIDTLIFECNISTQCTIGHLLKTRAKWNYIHSNHFADGPTGKASRHIDISNGGEAVIKGNSFTQGPQAVNNNVIGYGLEGLYDPFSHSLIIANNTLINYRRASHVFIDLPNHNISTVVINNLFGGGTVISRDSLALFDRNLVKSDPSDFQFNDLSKRDYRLTSQSPGIDSGRTIRSGPGQFLPLPLLQMNRDGSCSDRRVDGLAIDLGAFEYQTTTGVNYHDVGFEVFPNPASTYLVFRSNKLFSDSRVLVFYHQNGQEICRDIWSNGHADCVIKIRDFPRGIIIWKLISRGGLQQQGKVVLH